MPLGLSTAATANDAGADAFDTIHLEGMSLKSGEFIILVDTTPAKIESAHVAMHVPCQVDGDDAETDIAIVAGLAPDVSPVNLEYVAALSDPDNDRCTFHVTVPEEDEDITDIAMINTGDNTITLDSGMFVTTSLSTTDDDDASDNDGNSDDDNDDE
jgi:hypothetical protein